MHDGQHGARASACVGREHGSQFDAVEPERCRDLRAETVGGVESELRLARETGSRRNLQRSRAEAVSRTFPDGTASSRQVRLLRRRCGTIHLGRPRPETTEKCSPDALGRPRHESTVANLPRSPSRFASRSSIASTATVSASSGVGELTLAKRTGSAFASSRHAASWRSISRNFELRLASVDLLRGCFEQKCQIGARQNLATQADEPRTGTQPVAPRIYGEVVPASLEDDKGGACSSPG